MSNKKLDTQLMLSNLENILRHAINNINKQEQNLNSIQEGGAKKNKSKVAKKRKKRVKIKKNIIKESCTQLIKIIQEGIQKIEKESVQYQKVLKCLSEKNRKELSSSKAKQFDYLYPNLDDSRFSEKLTKKKEFSDTQYEKKTKAEYKNIEQISNRLCEIREFELDPHQMFVRNL